MVLFSFSQNFCTMCKNFVKKKGKFRPAGGEFSFRVRNRVTPVIQPSAVSRQWSGFRRWTKVAGMCLTEWAHREFSLSGIGSQWSALNTQRSVVSIVPN
jgi:hypothetical protein